jgi:hypothetical protein
MIEVGTVRVVVVIWLEEHETMEEEDGWNIINASAGKTGECCLKPAAENASFS